MEEKDPKHDDMPQQLDIREVLLDAGYRQNRRSKHKYCQNRDY